MTLEIKTKVETYPKSIAYIRGRLARHRFCNRCGAGVLKSDVEGYSFYCVHCGENLYRFETHQDRNHRVKKTDIEDMALLVNQDLGLDNPIEDLADMPLYDYMKKQGIGDFTKGSKETDIKYFEWYMGESKDLHNLVSSIAVTNAGELALYIKNLQEKTGEDTSWFTNFLERKEEK